nr:histone deacetylase 14 [Tanacetum cinerariifolium]
FWDIVQYDKKAGNYRCQLDEQWFVLTKDTLSEALQITPINNNQPFIAPPSSDALINFVNELGYPKLVRNLSNVITNDMFQPWRALLTIINLCLTGKTSGFERPRALSKHTFVEDKRNLSRHTAGKKRATLIVIPSNRFTKLIIHHLQRRHKFHPRPASPLYLPNKEPVLGYLKFSAKGTKSEVFGMPIPGSLITADIQKASYYQEYLAKVAQHQRYLASETESVQDSPVSKPTKPARNPKSTAPKAPPRPAVYTPATSAQPAPTSAPAKPLEKKRKQATETSDKPPKAKKSKYGWVAAEDAELQKVLEESMKTAYDAAPRGPLPLVVIREPESGKYQPLSEVPGTGKAKVTEEQSDSEEESEKVVLGATEGGNDEHQAGPDPGTQAEGQTRTDAGTLDEGQAGSNPDEMSEGQAGPDRGNTGDDEQSIPSLVVHDGSDREHIDLDVADASPQPLTEQLNEGFTATAYPKVQENLKLAVEEQVLLEDPASSSGTLSSLQHLTAETEVESMVSITIQQEMSSIPPMKSPIIDLFSRPESPKAHQHKQRDRGEVRQTWGASVYAATIRHPPTGEQSGTHANLAEARKKKKKSRESSKTPPGSPPHQPPHPHPPAGPSGASGAPGALGASGSSQVPPPPPLPSYTNQESLSKGSAAPSSSKTAAPAEYQAWIMTEVRLRPSTLSTPAYLAMDEDMGLEEQAQLSDDEDIKSAHIPKVNLRQDWWKPLEEERPATPEPACRFHSLLTQTGDIAIFIDWFYKRRGITELKPQDLEGPAFEIVKTQRSKPLSLGGPPGQGTIQSNFFFNKDLEYLRYDSKGSRPALSISKMKAAYYLDVGLEQIVPDQFWIEEECKYDIAATYGISHWWFQRQRFYIDRHTSECDRGAVRTHMRILGVVRIEVFSLYGYDYMKKIVLRRADLNEHVIAERDFKYLYPSDFENLYLLNLQGHLNHLPPKDKKILSTAVNQWTRHLVIRQCVEDFQLGIESYQTQLNLTKPQWDTTGFEYKHDYTVIDSLRTIMFQDKYEVQMMMRFNEIHKYSDGTLQQIDEALNYRVKEFRINMMNPSLIRGFKPGRT